jgi:hypothetical protein
MTNLHAHLRRSLAPVWLPCSAAVVSLGLHAPAAALASPDRAASEPTGSRTVESTVPPSSESPGAAPDPESTTHINRIRGCRVSIDATSHRITAGDSVTVFGQLRCPSGESVADRLITVYQRQLEAGSARFIVGTASTEADGSYQLTPATFTTNSVFLARSPGAVGTHTGVRVAPQVTFGGPPAGTPLYTGAGHSRATAQYRVTFSGIVSPAGMAGVAVLQREDALTGENWHSIAVGQVDEEGKYSIAHTFGAPGNASLRVVVRPRDGLNVAATSESLSYDISQRQNPRLTIQVSRDPITYGQSVTVTGVAAGAASRPVTLLARTRGNAFAAVAKGTTDGSGAYTFTQSPPQSTFYEVTTATQRSVQPFEGVKYGLSPEPTPGAVAAGQPVSCSGTIAPGRVGQLVYLERQHASGIGFDRVAVGTVTAASTYSIEHTFYNAATDIMRIRVPGDSADQGTLSEPFTIQVTPTPAAALGSEAPAGSLSGEG